MARTYLIGQTKMDFAANAFITSVAARAIELRPEDAPWLATLGPYCQRALGEDEQIALLEVLSSCPNVAILLRLTEAYPAINTLLNEDFLQPYWNELWRLSGNNPTPTCADDVCEDTAYHDRVPEAHINSFTLVRGLYFYNLALALDSPSSSLSFEQKGLLQRAAGLNYFPAIQRLLEEETFRCMDFSRKPRLQTALVAVQRLATTYGTPGLMILAEVNFQLAMLAHQQSTVNREEVIRHFTEAIKAAQQAESQYYDSVAAINNFCKDSILSSTNSFAIDNPAEAATKIMTMATAYGYHLPPTLGAAAVDPRSCSAATFS